MKSLEYVSKVLIAMCVIAIFFLFYKEGERSDACKRQGGVYTQNGQCVIFPASMGVRVR